MKKWVLMVLLFAVLGCYGVTASCAESYVLPTPEDEKYTDENGDDHYIGKQYQMLCDGDTLHFLMIHDHFMHHPYNVSQYGAACYVLNEDGSLTECGSHCGDVFQDFPPYEYDLSVGRPFVFMISPQNETYFLTLQGQVLQWQPNESTAWKPLAQLDFSGIDTDDTFRNETEHELFKCMIDGNTLYAAFKNAGDGYTIHAFQLEDGSRKEVGYVGSVLELIPAQDGKVLSVCSPKTTGGLPYHFIDTQSGELEEFVLGLRTMYCSGLVYDRQGGWYYASHEGDIRFLSGEGEETTVVPFPKPERAYGGGGSMVLSMDGSRAYLMVDNDRSNTIAFHIIDLTATQQAAEVETLVFDGTSQYISNFFGDLPAFADFAAQRGNVQAAMQQKLKYAKAISQAFVMKNDSFDVIVTHTSALDFDNLYEKGYYVDLSDRDEIVAYFDRLYPAWKDECMRDGKIMAFPVRVDDYNQFMYNTELFAEWGLTVPTTYAELFDALREWSDMGILEATPLFDINGNQTRSYQHIFDKLMGDYILLCEQDGKTPDLGDREFIAALEELDTLRDMLDAHDAQNLTGTPLLIFSGYPTALGNHMVYDAYGTYELMPLGYGKENREVLQCSLAVMIVNPYSRNVELAKDYIAWVSQNPTPKAQHVMLEGGPEGMEAEYSIENRIQWEAEAAEAAQALEEAKASDAEEIIQAALMAQASVYGREPETEWLVRPDRSRQLYRVLADAGVRSYTYYQLMDNGEKAIQRYLAGDTEVRDMLESLQEILWMMEAE